MPEKPPPSLPPQRVRAPAVTIMDDEETINVVPLMAHRRERAVFTQMTGFEAGRVCGLDGESARSAARSTPDAAEVTFGRAATCSHAFDEASLSRVHARLVRKDRVYVIEDAGSRNGIFVNEVKVPRAELHDGDRVRLGSAVTLRFQMVNEQEENSLVKVYESSVKDGLTGAWNRKYLDERLAAEQAFVVRHPGAQLAVVLADIDHFKKINDTYGHQVGDEVLKATAGAMRAAIRTEDLLARYGGEEFVVVARGVDLKSAAQLAERLRVVAERNKLEVDGQTLSRTISAGVATLECCGAEATVERLLGLADERLYRAKETGRNRVVSV